MTGRHTVLQGDNYLCVNKCHTFGLDQVEEEGGVLPPIALCVFDFALKTAIGWVLLVLDSTFHTTPVAMRLREQERRYKTCCFPLLLPQLPTPISSKSVP